MKQNWVKFRIPSPRLALELSRLPENIKAIFLEVYIFTLNPEGVPLEYYPAVMNYIDKLSEWFLVDSGIIYNLHFLEAEESYEKRSTTNRENIQKRYESNTNPIQTEEKETTNPIRIESNRIDQNRIDQIRSEKKEKINKKENNPVYTEEFEKAWIAYERKGSKKDAWTEWKKIKVNIDDLIAAINAYKEASPEIKYRKDFERYLKSRLYEGEFEKIETKKEEERKQKLKDLEWKQREIDKIEVHLFDYWKKFYTNRGDLESLAMLEEREKKEMEWWEKNAGKVGIIE